MGRRLTDAEREAWEIEVGKRRASAMAEESAPAQATAHMTRKKSAASAPPLQPLTRRDAAQRSSLKGKPDAKIDLHDLSEAQAHAALERFLERMLAAGKRHLVIITGKGRGGAGALKRAVPLWLELPRWRGHIAAIAYAPPEKGGEGVLHVLLKARP